MRRNFFWGMAAGCLSLLLAAPAGAVMPRHPLGRVSDFAKIINETTAAEVNRLAEAVENTTGAQMAVVTVASLDNQPVEEYANKLFGVWGIGQKGKNNGVLFLVAPAEHKVRIEVGYGLEGDLNDGRAGRILAEDVVPYFKTGDYNQGILYGSRRIAAVITHEQLGISDAAPPDSPKTETPPMDAQTKVMLLLFFGLFVTLGFYGLGAGFRGQSFFIIWGAGFGGIPLAMSVVFGQAFGFPIMILPLWALVMLLTGLVTGKHVKKWAGTSGQGSSGGGWSSGTSFSSSSGFGGGSSFSDFGGGSSGGGGASSSW